MSAITPSEQVVKYRAKYHTWRTRYWHRLDEAGKVLCAKVNLADKKDVQYSTYGELTDEQIGWLCRECLGFQSYKGKQAARKARFGVFTGRTRYAKSPALE